MHINTWVTTALGATLVALAPIGTMANDVPQNGPIVTVIVSATTGPDAARITGTVPGAHQLQALIYAKFGADVPAVLLSRRFLTADADGRFSTIVPIAPAYFPGTVITVFVQSLTSVPLAQGTMTIGEPVVPPSAR